MLLKQLLSYYLPSDPSKTPSHYTSLLTKITSLKILDALVFFTSLFNSPFAIHSSFLSQIPLPLFHSIFYMTRLFTPKTLLTHSTPLSDLNHVNPCIAAIKLLNEKETIEKQQRHSFLSSRPNNFGTRIKVARPIENGSFIISNVNQFMHNRKQLLNEKIKFAQQKTGGKGK